MVPAKPSQAFFGMTQTIELHTCLDTLHFLVGVIPKESLPANSWDDLFLHGGSYKGRMKMMVLVTLGNPDATKMIVVKTKAIVQVI